MNIDHILLKGSTTVNKQVFDESWHSKDNVIETSTDRRWNFTLETLACVIVWPPRPVILHQAG